MFEAMTTKDSKAYSWEISHQLKENGLRWGIQKTMLEVSSHAQLEGNSLYYTKPDGIPKLVLK